MYQYQSNMYARLIRIHLRATINPYIKRVAIIQVAEFPVRYRVVVWLEGKKDLIKAESDALPDGKLNLELLRTQLIMLL